MPAQASGGAFVPSFYAKANNKHRVRSTRLRLPLHSARRLGWHWKPEKRRPALPTKAKARTTTKEVSMILDALRRAAFERGEYDHVPTAREYVADVARAFLVAVLLMAALWLGCFWAAM